MNKLSFLPNICINDGKMCKSNRAFLSCRSSPLFVRLSHRLPSCADSLRCSNHTNERKNVSEDIQTPSLTHHRTRHPDFLPRRGENLPRRGKKLPRLPGKTTTPINSNLNPQKTKLMGDETETAATAAFMLSADTNDHNAW